MEVTSSVSAFAECNVVPRYKSGRERVCVVSPASFFNEFEQPQYKEDFGQFISNRLKYLKALEKIGNNWISGESKQPPQNTIEIARNFLKGIESWYIYNNEILLQPPKILLGPIPSGGIAIDLKFSPNISFLITIYEYSIELEKEEEGYYSDIPVQENNFLDKIVGYLQNYISVSQNYI